MKEIVNPNIKMKGKYPSYRSSAPKIVLQRNEKEREEGRG